MRYVANTDISHYSIQRTQSDLGIRQRTLNGLCFTHVARDGSYKRLRVSFAQIRRHSRQGIAASCSHHNIGSLGEASLSDCTSDAAAGAGHENCLTSKI